MSNQEPRPYALRLETSTRNLVSHIESNINKEGNKQLMLFLGIYLGDTDIVNRAIGLGADVTEELSNRNEQILSQMGYGPLRPSSPIGVEDIPTN